MESTARSGGLSIREVYLIKNLSIFLDLEINRIANLPTHQARRYPSVAEVRCLVAFAPPTNPVAASSPGSRPSG